MPVRTDQPSIWLDKKVKLPNATKSGSLQCYPLFMFISRDIDDQRIQKSDRSDERDTWPHLSKVIILGATFPWWISPCKRKLDINSLFSEILMTKESINLIVQTCEELCNLTG